MVFRKVRKILHAVVTKWLNVACKNPSYYADIM